MSTIRTSVRPTTVRAASIGDADAIGHLAAQLGYPSHRDDLRRRLSATSARNDQAIYVAERDGYIIGWVHAHLHASLVDDLSAEIAGLVVDEHHRGTGAGRALMAAAESWARSQGCNTVRLRSNVIRTGAHEFYKRLGYTINKTQHSFRKQIA